MRYKIEGEFEVNRNVGIYELTQGSVSYWVNVSKYKIIDLGDCYLVQTILLDKKYSGLNCFTLVSKDLISATEQVRSINEVLMEELSKDARARYPNMCNIIRIMSEERFSDGKAYHKDTRTVCYSLVEGTDGELFLCKHKERSDCEVQIRK